MSEHFNKICNWFDRLQEEAVSTAQEAFEANPESSILQSELKKAKSAREQYHSTLDVWLNIVDENKMKKAFHEALCEELDKIDFLDIFKKDGFPAFTFGSTSEEKAEQIKTAIRDTGNYYFDRYYHAFTMKVAMGDARYVTGEKSADNSGYRAGAILVNHYTEELINSLEYKTGFNDTITSRCLGAIIRHTIDQFRGRIPLGENMMHPTIIAIEPQVSLMSPENRDPQNIFHIIRKGVERAEGKWVQTVGRSSQDLVKTDKGNPVLL